MERESTEARLNGTEFSGGEDSGPEGDGRYREPRAGRLLACDMKLQDGSVVRVRVRNISSGGLGGRTDVPIDAWQRVEVRLPGVGAVAGRIAWVRQGQFGVQFDHAIDPGKALVGSSQPQTRHVVPSVYQTGGDFRRPGLRTK